MSTRRHKSAKRQADRRAAFTHYPAVPGTGSQGRNWNYLPRSVEQERILRSPEALYGRTTYYSGETPANTPTYAASGINPARLASIYTEVVTIGRMVQKADLDEQIMRRDTHLLATDQARIAALASRQVLTQPNNESELARDLAYLALAMIDDTDGFDLACGQLLKANRSGYGVGEAVFASKALHVAGTSISIPGAWPQQIDEVFNRNIQFEPVTDKPLLNQGLNRFADLGIAPYKMIFHSGVGSGYVRMRGHLVATVWPHMIKHDGMSRFAQCLDFYGIPHPYAEIPWDQWQNKELQEATKEAMEDYGDGNPYVKVQEVKWGFTDTPTGLDARGMHAVLWGLCNTEQSKAVQGETLTTELGGVGGYNTSQTHEAVKADIVALDERALANTIRKWIRAVFQLNMPAICRAFGKTSQEILGCIPKVYWLIHRAMDPETRQRMRFAAVAAGLPIDVEQEYRENGWAKPTQPHRAIQGEGVIVSDGAQSVGSLHAAAGIDNPKDLQEVDGQAAAPSVELTPSAQSAVIKVNEGRRMLDLPPGTGGNDRFISQAAAAQDGTKGAMSQYGAMSALSALSAIHQGMASRFSMPATAHNKDSTR